MGFVALAVSYFLALFQEIMQVNNGQIKDNSMIALIILNSVFSLLTEVPLLVF